MQSNASEAAAKTAPGDRAKLRRRPARGCYEQQRIHAILDEAPICHIAVAGPATPVVIPTLHARCEQQIYLHGSAAADWVRLLADGAPACLTATILDGLVFARSALHHSVNYRSVVLFGTGRAVTERAEQLTALRLITDRLMPGRWDEARPPTPNELARVGIVSIAIEEASAKIRSGDPCDEADDLRLDVWAGVLPIESVAGVARSDPLLRGAIKQPASLAATRAAIEARAERGAAAGGNGARA